MAILDTKSGDRDLTHGEIIGQMTPLFKQGLSWMLFRPKSAYAEPAPNRPNNYQIVTPRGINGPHPTDLILQLIRMRWIAPDPDNPHRAVGVAGFLDSPEGRPLRRYLESPR